MAENTNIEWTDATFNPWIGCTRVSPGCDNCYAARQDNFRHWTTEGWGGPRKRTAVANWRKPKTWNDEGFAECPSCGWRGELRACNGVMRSACPACFATVNTARRRVFCASLADVFDNEVDPAWQSDLFDLIRATPNLDWLVLTKRIGNVRSLMGEAGFRDWPNVWLGATVVSQEEADRDIPKLLATNASVRFLSMEPLLAPVRLFAQGDPHPVQMQRGVVYPPGGLGWVIAGGESGPGARPMHPQWARSLRDQCAAAGVPFFMKQMGGARDKRGSLEDLPEDLRAREYPHANT